jgi:hypothetical protein
VQIHGNYFHDVRLAAQNPAYFDAIRQLWQSEIAGVGPTVAGTIGATRCTVAGFWADSTGETTDH